MSLEKKMKGGGKTGSVRLRSLISRYRHQQILIRELVKSRLKKPESQASLMLVGTIFFIALLAVLALRPTLVTISELVREIELEKENVQQLDRKISSLQAARVIMQEVEGRLYLLEDAIPPKHDLEVFSKEVELLAIDRELTMVEIVQGGLLVASPELSESKSSKVTALQISLTVGGSEESIRLFTKDLESLDRLLVVNSVVFSSISVEDRTDQPYPVRAVLAINIYYQ